MIEEDRAARITNQVAKRLKPRSRMQLLPDDQSNASSHLTYYDQFRLCMNLYYLETYFKS